MASVENLTLNEASYVLDRSPAKINKAVDTGLIRTRQRRVGKIVQRLLGLAELRFLRLTEDLDKDLTPSGRRRLYEAIRRLAADSHRVSLGELVLDLAHIDIDLAVRLQRLDTIRNEVDFNAGQRDAVIKGTEIPAHLVAALARGQTMAEILEDLPSLTRDQVEAAIDYAKIYPKRGRSHPTRSFKRMLADMAELGVFDESTDQVDATPREIP